MTVQPGFTIAGGGYEADISRTGAGLRGLRLGGVALTEEWPLGEKPPLSAGLVLAPWPGRTEDGVYSFGGKVHRLPVTNPQTGTADHGLVRRVDWDDVETAPDAVTLAVEVAAQPGWPFGLRLRIRYRVGADGLTCRLDAENVGTEELPFAVGFHTYLRVGDAPVDECTLELGARRWQPLSDRLLPDGPPLTVTGTEYDFTAPRSLAGVRIDTPFTDVTGEYTVRSGDGQVTLWTDPALGWVQAFVADPADGKGFPGRGPNGGLGRALAVEPMSAPGNALHTGTDVAAISPGDQWGCTWGIRGVLE